MAEKTSVSIDVPAGRWADFVKEAGALGFSGKEFLTLLFLNFSEVRLSLQWFEEMNEVPRWARSRLGIKKALDRIAEAV